PAGTLQGLAKAPHGLECGGTVEERDQQPEIEIRQHTAPGGAVVATRARDVDLDAVLLPDPDLADAQAPVDLQLVDAPPRPDDLDDEVGDLLALVRSDDVALVRLRSALPGRAL